MKTTLRKCGSFLDAVEELKTRGSFKFRQKIALLAFETKRQIELFNEAQKPAKGITEFQKEVELIRENCTVDKDGKAQVNVSAFMPLYDKARAKHAKAIEAAERLQADAKQQLDEEFEIALEPISVELLEEVDKEEKLEASLLAKIMPFVD